MELAVGADHHRAAIEDELVLATDEVDVDDRPVRLACPGTQDRLALAPRRHPERRGIGDQHRRRALARQPAIGPVGIQASSQTTTPTGTPAIENKGESADAGTNQRCSSNTP